MRRLISILIAMSLSSTAVADDWPVFRGDAAGTGVAQSILPNDLQLLWKFTPGETVFEATAAIVDGVVYVGDADRAMHALRLADGKELWSSPADHGYLASAAVRDGRVYAGDSSGVFHCLDAATGKELWKFTTQQEINSSANFFADSVLFGSQDGTLYRLRTSDGKQLWKFTIAAEGGIQSSPTLAGSQVFFSGCDGKLHIVDVAAGRETANIDIDSPTLSTAAVTEHRAYFGTEGGNFFAVSWPDPKIVWKYRHSRGGLGYRSSAAIAGPLVVLGGRNRMVQGLRQTDGKVIWSFTTGGRIDSSPVVSGSRVYVGSFDGRIYALAAENGKLAWKYDAGGHFLASPAISRGRLVIGNENGTVYCFGEKAAAAK